jgi:hypothetical protein
LPPFEVRCQTTTRKDADGVASGRVRISAESSERVELTGHFVSGGRPLDFRAFFRISFHGTGDYLSISFEPLDPVSFARFEHRRLTSVDLSYSGDTTGGQDTRGVYLKLESDDPAVPEKVLRTGVCSQWEKVQSMVSALNP